MTSARVLIVEDENIVAENLASQLQQQGYTVTALVASGEQAIRQAAETRPDVVLMDIRLRGETDGIQAAAEIRAQFDLPVIYMTGYSDEATLQRAHLTEPFGYLLKPFEARELRVALEMALYKHAMEKRLRQANEELELRVRERTAELAAANAGLQAEIAERETLQEQIAERQKVEWSQRLLEKALETMNVGVTISDPSGMIIYANPAEARMHGYTVQELLGQPSRILAPPDQWRLSSKNERTESWQNWQRESINMRKDGQAFPVRLVSDVVKDANGELIGVVVSCLDITECKHMEEALRQANEELELRVQARTAELAAANATLQAEIAKRQHIEQALRESEERYRTLYENAPLGIYRTTPDGQILMANPAAVQMVGYASFDELAARNLEREGFDANRPRRQFTELMERHGQVTGLESAWKRRDGTVILVRENARAFRGPDGAILYYEGAVEDITERRRMEDALRVSEQNYREIFDATSETIFVHDAETGAILDVNRAMLDMYGYAGPDALRLTVHDLSAGQPPYTQVEASQWIRRAIEQGPQLFEWQARKKNGELFWAEVALKSSSIGGAGRVLAVVRDVSARKQAEEAVRQAEKRYRELFEEAPLMYVITRNQAGIPVIENCNQLFLTTLQYRRDELQGHLLTDVYTPESRAKLLEGGYQRELNGHFEPEERELVTRDGRIIQTLLTTRPEVGADGRVVGTRAMYLDITARKRAELALEESEQRFRRLANNAPDVIYRCELVPELRLTYINPATTAISGYSPEELHANISSALDLVHPEDRPLLASAFQGSAGRDAPIVVRWIHKDGTLIWIEHRHMHVHDSAGRLVAVEGIARDITQRKWAEVALQESETRYRRRSSELEALHRISLSLNTVRDISDLLHCIVDQAAALLGAQAGGVYLYDQQRGELRFAVGVGYAAEYAGTTLKSGEGLAGQVLVNQRSMIVEDYATWPGRAEVFDGDTRLKAVLAVPLAENKTALGVLTVIGSVGQLFDEHDLWLVEMFALQASVAMQNANLQAETQRRTRLLETLNKAGQAMSSTLDFQFVLNQVIEEVRKLLAAEGASILLRDPASSELVFAATAGQGARELVGTRMPMNVGIAGWVMRERQPVLVHDTQCDVRFWETIDRQTGMTTRTLAAVPLKYKASVWGVIEAINKADGPFDKLDMEMLEALASSAAIAIENARLYGAEKEQRRLVEQSQLQLAESEKLAATGRLAATLAHEINNPLQAISNSMQLMLNFELDPDERRECVQLAASEVERLADIVSRTLDFARRPHAEMKPASLNQIIEKVLALSSKYLQHRHIALERDLAPDLQPIRANPEELAQVFLNLVLNAVDAMPEGGTLRVTTGSGGEGFLTADFGDTGCGIPPENLERIFEPFFTTKSDGTGLGLSVSAGVVGRHSGKITVQSQVNRGTIFTVWLPAVTN
jgi:PAS domain S-box-containing protein